LKTVSSAEFVAAARTVSLSGTVIDGSLSHRLAGRHQRTELIGTQGLLAYDALERGQRRYWRSSAQRRPRP
jgi:hypothetical protein